MPQKPNLLTIDPDTRKLGVAVMQEQQLLFYTVKTIKPNQDKLKQIEKLISNLIENYEITVLIIKKIPHSYINAKEITNIANYIKKLAQKINVSVFQYTPKFACNSVCKSNNATRKQTANRIAIDYPVLAKCLDPKKDWQKQYYGKIFTAISLGLTYYYQQEKSNIIPYAQQTSL